MRTRADIIAAARACVGARFRVHGRDPAFGLDCVGLAGAAFGRAVPDAYPVRGGSPAHVADLVAAAGLRRIPAAEAGPGDLLLVEAGPRQLHLVVLTPEGFVHADAGLRRVVEAPGAPPGAILGAWDGEG